MKETIFKKGDRVRHRASKIEGVITDVNERCINDEHKMKMHCISDRSNCNRKPNGEYDVSIDFDKELEGVDGILLEYSDATKRNAEANRIAMLDFET